MNNFYSEFYPTPKPLISRMIAGIRWREVSSILEPSAGKGDIADVIVGCYIDRYTIKPNVNLDCIEINPELQTVLKGKGHRVVYDDFLTFKTFKHYDLIIMNPPFSNGEKHLQKALEMQKRGGAIICLLNAETLKNLCTIDRILLKDELEKYGAEITYLKNEFSQAYRKTDVEIALIKVSIPNAEDESTIISELKQARQRENVSSGKAEEIVDGDLVNGIVQQYNFEAEAGIKMIREFNAIKPYMSKDFEGKDSILTLALNNFSEARYGITENKYLRELRYKYWHTLFDSSQFTNKFTSNLIEKVYNEVNGLREYDFTVWNINQVRMDMVSSLTAMIESTILKLFDTMSQKHSWNATDSKNIHYFNGWRTNNAYKIGKKVILPLQIYDDWGGKLATHGYGLETLTDMEKTFQYLDGEPTDSGYFMEIVDKARESHETKLHCKYFDLVAYRKGTVHITFTNEKLLKKFNLYGSQKKGWLPPSYSKVHYDEMTAEDKKIVDSFEGEESYEDTLEHAEYYLSGINTRLLSA